MVKLTADARGEPPSAMFVVGAPGGNFEYGGDAGDGGCFASRCFHASVAPTSPSDHLKMVFFFTRSEQARRRTPLTASLDAVG